MNILGWNISRSVSTTKTAGRKRGKRYYQAAKKDSLTAGWGTANYSADTTINADLPNLRARSRLLAVNEPFFKYWLKILNRNVVGPHGVRLQMRVIDRFNNDGSVEYDGRANRIIEEGWKRWCKRENCTIKKNLNFVMVQKLVLKSWARDGEIFVRKIAAYKGNAFKFALQLIEADHLDIDYTATLANNNVVRMGVEYDADGAPVAYYFLQRHPGDYLPGHNAAQYRIRILAAEIIHIFDPERVDQTRGVPEGAASMTRSNMLNGYYDAELVAARVSASKMGFFTTPDGEGYEGDDSEHDDDGNETAVITDADPGTFEELPEGYGFQSFDPQHPTTAFDSFTKGIAQSIASGLNINYSTMANDYAGVNFSSLRQANLNDRDAWKEMQQWLIEQLHEQIFPEWLKFALLTGQLDPLPAAKYEKFNAASWRPRGWSWIDPQKEAIANRENVALGVETLTNIAAEQGRDIEEIFAERKSEVTLAEKHGINLVADPATTIQVNENGSE